MAQQVEKQKQNHTNEIDEFGNRLRAFGCGFVLLGLLIIGIIVIMWIFF